MDIMYKFLIGLSLFIITSIVAYLFKMRQLYIVAPKLYRNSALSESSTVCELIVFNKGNTAEEEIKIEIDQNLKCEIIASSESGVVCENSVIVIERLHKSREVSIILMLENGILDIQSLLSISSKECVGTIHRKVEEIPPNYAKLALGFFGFAFVLFIFMNLPKVYEYIQEKRLEIELEPITKLGWSGLSNYYSSDLRLSYSNQEFPLHLLSYKRNGKFVYLKFEAINKTAEIMKVIVETKTKYNNNNSDIKYKDNNNKLVFFRNSIELEPLSKNTLDVPALMPEGEKGEVEVEIYFQFVDEFIHKIKKKVVIDTYDKTVQSIVKSN